MSRRGDEDDETSFAEFVRASQSSLQRSAWMLTGDWSYAEDLTQTALLKTWKHWHDVGSPDVPEAYARRALYTSFVDWTRPRLRQERSVSTPEPGSATSDLEPDAVRRVVVARALAALPRRQRAVVVLRFFEDLSEATTAQVLQCHVGTVKSQASKALKRLRRDPNLGDYLKGRANAD